MLSLRERLERYERFAVMYKRGDKVEYICATLGIDRREAQRLRRKLGITPRHPNHSNTPVITPTLNDRQTMLALSCWRRGMDTLQIQRAVGATTEAAVYNTLSNERSKRHAPPMVSGERGNATQALERSASDR